MTYADGVIPGDGIGPELVESALTVLDAVSARYGFAIETTTLDAGADTYRRTGTAMAADAIESVRRADATLKGPVGLPAVRHRDGTEAGLLGGILRNGLDLYANVRPILLLPGVESRLRAAAGDIDYVIVRENTEGCMPRVARASATTMPWPTRCPSPRPAARGSRGTPSSWLPPARALRPTACAG